MLMQRDDAWSSHAVLYMDIWQAAARAVPSETPIDRLHDVFDWAAG